MKEGYIKLIQWLNENPKFSYWIVLFCVSFILLLMIYLFITNLRLHLHIKTLNKDKDRLMQEKDLMRKGLEKEKAPETL